MMEAFTDFKQTYIKECKECGACLKNCYAYKKTKFPIFKHLKEFFQDQKHEKDINKFLNACLYCKDHEHACIRDIDLSPLLPAIKHDLSMLQDKYTWIPQNMPPFLVKFLRSEKFYYFWRNMNHYLVPEEFRNKYKEHKKYKSREVVFFSGCGIQLLENQYYNLLDIFKKLDVNFGLVDGSHEKPVCCGAVHCEVGNFNNGIRMLKNLVQEVKKYGTNKIIVYCATCYFGLTQLAPQLLNDFDLEVQHATQYISEYIEDNGLGNGLLKAPNGKSQVFTIHDSCHLAHGPKGDTTSIRKLISLLPLTKINEMKHHKENSLCDASYLLGALRNPLSLMFRNDVIPIIDEAINTNADSLCSLCPGCHALLSIFGSDIWTTLGLKSPRVTVKNWVEILGEYLGIRRKDMLNHRFSHIITLPFRDSGIWYIWQGFKAVMRGYVGMKEPKHIEKVLKRIRKRKKKNLLINKK